jgi:hypothetical protein
MTDRQLTTISVTKLLLDLIFWIGTAGAVLLTLFVAFSPMVMRDGRVADAAFPVAIGVGTPRPVLPLTVDAEVSPAVQRAVIVDARGELRLRTSNWPLQFLPNVGILAALWVVIAIVYLIRGVLQRVKEGDPFARANVRSLRIIGWTLLAIGVLGPVLEYLIVRSVLTRVALRGVDLTAPFDIQTNAVLTGLLVLVLSGIFRHGADLERDRALTI